ncbi:MAG: hypothetical protein LJE91_09210 [Gammaproteobacteria bacterium]|nr:hypothetical protein [Gammaproteobacteria bacterium]
MADLFFEPFESGLSGPGDSLRRTLNRMAADIVAAQLAKKLFGDYGSGGGIVGAGGPTRAVPALAFASAPRFHSGGEVPAILTKGEEDLTRSDPRHRANLGAGGINITNQFTLQGEVSRATQEQIAAHIGGGVARAMRRNR